MNRNQNFRVILESKSESASLGDGIRITNFGNPWNQNRNQVVHVLELELESESKVSDSYTTLARFYSSVTLTCSLVYPLIRCVLA